MSFRETLQKKRILVCAGSGGVGKTTTAAALALQGALGGRKTLVLTIDPAKRLANSLGLPQLDHAEREIPADVIRQSGAEPRAPLYAMMLDQKRAFDEVVEKHTRDPATRTRVLENKIYKQISSSLSGSHEYAAMAKLYQIARETDYELVVVDTPPTAHALDFLDAPEKVANAVDSPAIDWFKKGMQKTGTFSLKMIGMSGSWVLKRIARFVGSGFLEDMAQFFVEAGDVLGGFRERARNVFELLRQDTVGFILVAAPDPGSIDEALYFHERLAQYRMPFSGFVVNRVHAPAGPAPDEAELAKRLGALSALSALPPYELHRAARALAQSHRDIGILADTDGVEMARLKNVLRQSEVLAPVPFFDRDIHSVEGLLHVGAHLLGQEAEDTKAAAAAP